VHSYSGSKGYDGAEFLTKQIQNANVKIVHGGCSYCVLIMFIRNHDSHVSSYTLQTIFRMMKHW